MWLLIAEMVLALGLIVFIMWWTLRARVDHPVDQNSLQQGQSEQSDQPAGAESARMVPPEKD
ncbi:MAG TPA: hypothetical protein VFV28_03045 [Limnobacter sp.]|nr:hypothetical protein [Limnobacter sp.]